jgi:hypothetical protein
MIYASLTTISIVLFGGHHVEAFTAPRAALVQTHLRAASSSSQPALAMMTAGGRRAQLGALAAGLSAVSTAASAAEPRSTPWAYSTFLEAIETDQIEKVSFSADGKQVLSIDRDGNRCAPVHFSLIVPPATPPRVDGHAVPAGGSTGKPPLLHGRSLALCARKLRPTSSTELTSPTTTSTTGTSHSSCPSSPRT